MMKNLALILLFVATAASTNAQSVKSAGDGELITRFNVTYANRLGETKIWKAEDYEKGEWSESNKMGILGDCSPKVVDNPKKDAINQNAKCLQLTVGAEQTEGQGGYDLFKMDLPVNDETNHRFNLYGRRRISLLYKPGVKSTESFNVNLELHRTTGGKKYALKLGAWYDGKGGGNAFTSTLNPTKKRARQALNTRILTTSPTCSSSMPRPERVMTITRCRTTRGNVSISTT